jgi:hypothetical protein
MRISSAEPVTTAEPAPLQPSPQHDRGRGADEDDDEPEEDQEARNRELQRIHEELQKEDDRRDQCMCTQECLLYITWGCFPDIFLIKASVIATFQ